MPRSPILQAIDSVLSGGISPLLQERGFKKKERSFHRRVGDLYHTIHVQASRHNTLNSGKFTLNLGIASPELAELWRDGRAPRNPANPTNSLLSVRIGSLLPGGTARWWEIGPGTDLDALAADLRSALELYALDFFENPAFQSADALLEALEDEELPADLFPVPTARKELHALLLHRAGREQASRSILAGLVDGAEGKRGLGGYVRRIKKLGARLGFIL